MGKGEIDGLVLNTTGIGIDLARRARRGPAPRRPDHRHRHDRRSRHGGDGRAARPGARRRSPIGRRADQRAHSCGARCRAWRRRGDEGPHARRRRLGAPRDGGEERRRHHRSTRLALPVRAEVRAAAELVGIDPLHVANEGQSRARRAVRRTPRPFCARCTRIRSAATPRSSARAPPIASARSCSTPASAGGSCRSPRASCCRVSAEANA